MIRQIFLNLYTACLKKFAKACWLNLSYYTDAQKFVQPD